MGKLFQQINSVDIKIESNPMILTSESLSKSIV